VLIDSSIARRRPEAERVLVAGSEIDGLNGEDLARVIRVRARHFGQAEGTIGGNATKQVRFDFGTTAQSIVDLLRLRPAVDVVVATSTSKVERLRTEDLRQVTPLHVLRAVDRLLAGEDAPNFAPSRDYDALVPGDARLAPKKVFGLAIEQALGIEAFPGHFSAGWGQPCFNIIQQAGFAIVAKNTSGDVTKPIGAPLPANPEEQGWAEGHPRLAQHIRLERRRDPRAAAAKRSQVRARNEGLLSCENPSCTVDWYTLFPIAIAEAVFEIHHDVPVNTMKEDHLTRLDDLRCLCASCHRAEHRRLALEPG
jgi:5-methylcytosine-specific restriction protein A